MLCSHVEALKSHAATTKLFLVNIRLIISPDNEKHKMQLTQFFLGIVVNVISWLLIYDSKIDLHQILYGKWIHLSCLWWIVLLRELRLWVNTRGSLGKALNSSYAHTSITRWSGTKKESARMAQSGQWKGGVRLRYMESCLFAVEYPHLIGKKISFNCDLIFCAVLDRVAVVCRAGRADEGSGWSWI